MIKMALIFLQGYLIREKIIKVPYQAEAIRFFNYPYPAIEEAIVNAMYRGYDVREPVEVRILSDRVEITSYPGLERSIPIKEVQDNNIRGKKYRNRRIGEFLKELKLTEGRNTGIPKIKRALKDNGSPEPIFETDEDRTYFITTILIHEAFKEEIDKEIGKEIDKEISTEKYSLTLIQQDIVSLMQKDPSITVSKIANLLNLPSHKVRHNVDALKEKGMIVREGATKNGKWIVK